MPAVACPLCAARAPRFLRAIENRDAATEDAFPTVSVSVCRRCGLIHQNPRISRARMTRLYARLEDKAGGGVTFAESRSRLAALARLRAAPASVLEAGCSDGSFLALAREAGYRVTGVEPSRVNLRKARAAHRGLALHEGFLESFHSRQRFDVLCHFYVLEYAFAPRRFLAAARRLLKPGGVMLLEVPDARAFARLPFAASLITHQDVCVFTRGTLAAMLRSCGFGVSARPLGAASKSYGLRVAAAPGAVAARGPSRLREGREAMERYFRRRDAMVERLRRRVSKLLPRLASHAGPVVIFGAGENGRIVLRTALADAPRDLLFCDNSATLQGRRIDGLPVTAPAAAARLRPAMVIAASVDYQDDMVRQMRSLGVPRARIVRLYDGF